MFETDKDYTTEEYIDYFVDENHKKVVAKLCVPQTTVMDEMLNVINKSCASHFLITNIAFQDNMLVSGTYTGIATCHPNDDFDVSVGMHVAKMKAIRSYMNDRKVVTARLARIFNDMATRVDTMDKHTDYAKASTNREIKSRM